MALTNYLAQGCIIAFALFGVGPGLGLAGRIGTCALTAIVVLGFGSQVIFSAWWLPSSVRAGRVGVARAHVRQAPVDGRDNRQASTGAFSRRGIKVSP